MARANDFVDPDYDRKLEEFKERRERMKKQMAEEEKESRRN